ASVATQRRDTSIPTGAILDEGGRAAPVPGADREPHGTSHARMHIESCHRRQTIADRREDGAGCNGGWRAFGTIRPCAPDPGPLRRRTESAKRARFLKE